MIDQSHVSQRGSFHFRYAIRAQDRDKRNTSLRLMDWLVVVAQNGDPNYFQPCEAGEFAIVDLATKEKGWFELQSGLTPDQVTRMIESNFAAPALRVESWLWVV